MNDPENKLQAELVRVLENTLADVKRGKINTIGIVAVGDYPGGYLLAAVPNKIHELYVGFDFLKDQLRAGIVQRAQFEEQTRPKIFAPQGPIPPFKLS